MAIADSLMTVAPMAAALAQISDHEVLEALPAALYLTDAEGRITFFNQAAADFWGRQPELGKEHWCGSWRLYRADGEPMAHDECPMAVTLRTGVPVRGVEAILERPDGSRAFFLPFPTPLTDAEGRVTGALNMLVDINDRKQAELQRQHFAAIVESSDDAIISKTLEGVITSWNKGAERIFGYTAAEAVGQPVLMLIPEERHNEEPGIIRRIRSGERIEHYRTVRRRKDGAQIDISLTVSPVMNDRGQIVGASKIARDITEHRRAEEAKELLLHEIKHRVKNTLGTVQAIAFQTFRDAPAAEREAFNARLRALAGAHDLLTRQDGDHVPISHIAERALAPFREDGGERLVTAGPDAPLAAGKALLLSMALHELATNAVKYGALSGATGQVTLSWRREANPDRMVFEWRESGGPRVSPPAARGFGSILIERALKQEGGNARLEFDPAGVVCRLEMEI